MEQRIKRYIDSLNDTGYETDIIYYGMQVFLFNVLTILIILGLSYLNSELMFGIFFMASFGIMRMKYNGFHCKTPLGCISTMIVLFESVIVLFKMHILSNEIIFIICCLFLCRSLIKKQKLAISIHFTYWLVYLFTSNVIVLSALCYALLLFQLLYYMRYHHLH